MTTIYLIRHAEAEGNLYRRIHGQYDSLVTLRGTKQIAELEKRFAPIEIDYVYSSDLLRAKATAGAVYIQHGLELSLTPQLREVNMGVWEDLTWGEVERFEPKQLEYFNNDPSLWKVDGCEDFDTLQKRMMTAIQDIADKHDGKTVAVVSHGSAIRAFMCGVFNVSPREIKRVPHCDNTAVALLRIENRQITVDYHSDNSHVPEALSTFAHQKWWRENTTYDSSNLRFTPFDLQNDTGRYLTYRHETMEIIPGALNESQHWLENAGKHAQAHSRAVSQALIYDTPAGMIELDTKQAEADKIGVIEFFYMENAHRRTGIAVQLLGQAVSVYRSLGREKLRMTVSEKNEQTLGFCLKYGFIKTGEIIESSNKYDIMEMNIALR
jgi:2,3-bisphosphoglycerate-dependent phosphoglycerate mutase